MKDNDCYIEHVECHLKDKILQKMKEVETPKKLVLDESNQTPPPALRSTPEPRKRLRKPRISPEVTAIKKPEEWVEVPVRKDSRKKAKPVPRIPERPISSRSEAVLIKPSKGLAMRKFCRVWKAALAPRTPLGIKVYMTKRPFRGTRKAYVLLEEANTLKVLKVAHIKIGWVCCRVRQKTEINRCYHCLGFGYMATDCRGPYRSRSCWKCVEEEHSTETCTRNPWCYLCTEREGKPRVDQIPGKMSCAAFGVGSQDLETGREF